MKHLEDEDTTLAIMNALLREFEEEDEEEGPEGKKKQVMLIIDGNPSAEAEMESEEGTEEESSLCEEDIDMTLPSELQEKLKKIAKKKNK